jgi:cupin superfamily acireductone dioxygenase involved in methionine salvage
MRTKKAARTAAEIVVETALRRMSYIETPSLEYNDVDTTSWDSDACPYEKGFEDAMGKCRAELERIIREREWEHADVLELKAKRDRRR